MTLVVFNSRGEEAYVHRPGNYLHGNRKPPTRPRSLGTCMGSFVERTSWRGVPLPFVCNPPVSWPCCVSSPAGVLGPWSSAARRNDLRAKELE